MCGVPNILIFFDSWEHHGLSANINRFWIRFHLFHLIDISLSQRLNINIRRWNILSETRLHHWLPSRCKGWFFQTTFNGVLFRVLRWIGLGLHLFFNWWPYLLGHIEHLPFLNDFFFFLLGHCGDESCVLLDGHYQRSIIFPQEHLCFFIKVFKTLIDTALDVIMGHGSLFDWLSPLTSTSIPTRYAVFSWEIACPLQSGIVEWYLSAVKIWWVHLSKSSVFKKVFFKEANAHLSLFRLHYFVHLHLTSMTTLTHYTSIIFEHCLQATEVFLFNAIIDFNSDFVAVLFLGRGAPCLWCSYVLCHFLSWFNFIIWLYVWTLVSDFIAYSTLLRWSCSLFAAADACFVLEQKFIMVTLELRAEGSSIVVCLGWWNRPHISCGFAGKFYVICKSWPS